MAAQLAANPSSMPRKSTDLHELHNAIESMDGISQDACSEIIAIAKLTLAYLERDDRLHDIDTVAQAIHAIWVKAEDMQNDINLQAGELDCGHTRALLLNERNQESRYGGRSHAQDASEFRFCANSMESCSTRPTTRSSGSRR